MHLVAMATFVQHLTIIVLTSTSTSVLSQMHRVNETDSHLMFMYDDLQCLTQMPLNDLLKIRRTISSFQAVAQYDEQEMSKQIDKKHVNDERNELRELPEAEPRTIFRYFNRKSSTEIPLAASLISTANAHDMMRPHGLLHKHGYAASGWEEEKPSKIQKVLHFSITALTFLAFAGYLLCMIVQAIKSKGTTYFHPGFLPMTMEGTTANRITGIRPIRFRRYTVETVAEPDPQSLYKALESFAMGYVQLNHISLLST